MTAEIVSLMLMGMVLLVLSFPSVGRKLDRSMPDIPLRKRLVLNRILGLSCLVGSVVLLVESV